MAEDDDIAIIGVGCRFPGANNLEEYWRVLSGGENHVKEIPRDRWNIDAFYDPDPNAPGKTYVRKAGFVDRIDEWDYKYYGINEIEVESVDPQQSLVLDCVHMALDDGGLTRDSINGANIGVYIGSMTDDYRAQMTETDIDCNTYTVTGTHTSIISARVAYSYNLTGPAITLDTACSSSLVAIDIGSQAVLSGKCDAAICGGVNVLLDPQMFIILSKARMLSPTGQCHTFTNDADGYARGEGCGVVIIKKYRDAKRDGNKIWATIKTATNQDGHMTMPITAPSGVQQQQLIEQIYRNNNIDKSRISLIEAHGTGTTIGDPIEANALGQSLGRNANKTNKEVYIGSVKTNIGHLEAAAAVAGIIKVLLMMKYEMIVPSLWYTKENENAKLNLEKYRFTVPMECIQWKRSASETRMACVNSFGFGGTNAHAIIEEFSDFKASEQKSQSIESVLPYIVAVSEGNKNDLLESINNVHEHLKMKTYDLPALSCTSTCKLEQKPVRKAVFGFTQSEILSACKAYLQAPDEPSEKLGKKKIIFVFCGVGTAWNGMCKDLMKIDAFKKAVESLDVYLIKRTGWSMAQIFTEAGDVVSDPFVSHLAIFACQIGFVSLWRKIGIEPDAILGQSVGEVAAAYMAGFVDLKTAVRIIYYRSKYLAKDPKGTMAVVRGIDNSIIEEFCKDNGNVTIAVYNSQNSCTVSGTFEDIQELKAYIKQIEGANADIIDLNVKCAYHSQYVKNAAKKLGKRLKSIPLTSNKIPFFSTVLGKEVVNGILAEPKYWNGNVRRPVFLSRSVEMSISKNCHNVFVEVGPAPVLRAHISNIFKGDINYSIHPSMKKRDEIITLTKTICSLYENGMELNWKEMFACQRHGTDIPTHWLKHPVQLYQSPNTVARVQGFRRLDANHLFIEQLASDSGSSHFKLAINKKTTPFIFDHRVMGNVVVPGATYADIGFEIGKCVLHMPCQETTVSLEFVRPVKLERNANRTLQISTVEQLNGTLFHVKDRDVMVCKGWAYPTHNSSEKCLIENVDIDSLKLSVSSVKCQHMEMTHMYSKLESIGFSYGPCFQMMKQCFTNGMESITSIEVPDEVMIKTDSTTVHPCILDVMIQSTLQTTTDQIWMNLKNENILPLPVAIGEINVFRKPEKQMYVYTKQVNTVVMDTVFQIHYNVLLATTDGQVVVNIRHYTTYGKRNACRAPCDLAYNLTWQPSKTLSREHQIVNILALSNEYNADLENVFRDHENVHVSQNTKKMNTEDYIATAVNSTSEAFGSVQNTDAVLMLLRPFSMSTDLDTALANTVHINVRNNCLIVGALLKYLKVNSITIPVYIVTQNTQSISLRSDNRTGIVGGEVWGFVRSIIPEFIYNDLTLVDIQPTVRETKKTLIKYISDTVSDIEASNQEIIIFQDKIFASQFTKSFKADLTPTLRAESKMSKCLGTTQRVLSTRSKCVDHMYLSDAMQTEQICSKDHIAVKVSSVYIHPLTVSPRTTTEIKHDQDIWVEANPYGNALYGLEYSGDQLTKEEIQSHKSPNVPKKAENSTINKVVCIFPSAISTEMLVPKDCVVSMKELPSYRTGLLLSGLLSWHFCENVPNKSKVVVHGGNGNTMVKVILEAMLQTRKHIDVIQFDDTSLDIEDDIGVLVCLQKVDPTLLGLKIWKRVVCLKGCVSDAVRLSASRAHIQAMVCVDVKDVLQRRNVKKCLPLVIEWLKKHYKPPNILANSKYGYPYSEHDVIQTKECEWNSVEEQTLTLNIREEEKLALPVRNSLHRLFSKAGVYIVTGGLTGLGWEIILLLAELGAGIIASMSRRDVSHDKKEEIKYVEKTFDCKIICVKGNVIDYMSVEKAVSEIVCLSGNCKIRGIFHCAGVLHGKLLNHLEVSHLDDVLQPKVIGTMNMHVATTHMDLDFFVVSSSLYSAIGTPGQSSYGAANCFLDTFMGWRRSKGLAGQSIRWGALSVGMASRSEFVDSFSKRGFNLLSTREMRSCLQTCLMQNATNVIYADINWEIFAKSFQNHSMIRERKKMATVFAQELAAGSLDVRDDNDNTFDVKGLQEVTRQEQMLALTRLVLRIANKLTPVGSVSYNSSVTLAEIGFDSMSALTFVNVLHDYTNFRIPSPFMAISDHSLDDIVQLLFDNLFRDDDELSVGYEL